ncbi:MAG: hypothetical protein KO464_01380 [Candidatus Methanofastidiosum sp.]|nr:hypothetical protein [Methanofastidiosum sp.]
MIINIVIYRVEKNLSEKKIKKKSTQFVASPDYVKTLACFDVSKRFKSKETNEKNIAFFSFLQTECLIKDLTITRAYALMDTKHR